MKTLKKIMNKSKSHPADLNQLEQVSKLNRTQSVDEYLIYNDQLNESNQNKDHIKTIKFNPQEYVKDSQLGIYFKYTDESDIVIEGFKPYTNSIKNYNLCVGMKLLSINNKSCENLNYSEAMLFIQYLWKQKKNIYLTFLSQKLTKPNSDVFEFDKI